GVHGGSSMDVYVEVVLLRHLLGAGVLAGLVILALVGDIAIWFGTHWAIPGWATYSAAALAIIFLQTLLISGIALFQLMSFRNVKSTITAMDAAYIGRASW